MRAETNPVAIGHHSLVAVPGNVIAVEITQPSLSVIAVRLTLDTGASLDVSLNDVYEPRASSVDVVDLYSFLLMQNTPPMVLQQALDGFNPDWEDKVQARKRENDRRSKT